MILKMKEWNWRLWEGKRLVGFLYRATQLHGNISIICANVDRANILKTEILLLNENLLNSIEGISCFQQSPLHVLSLSSNALESIPEEVWTLCETQS